MNNAERDYTTIHTPTEEALPEIPDASYDFVFALSSLLFVEDIATSVDHIHRIARRAVFISVDDLTPEYIEDFVVTVYNHTHIACPDAQEDYFIRGWTSPTTGISINTRILHIPKV